MRPKKELIFKPEIVKARRRDGESAPLAKDKLEYLNAENLKSIVIRAFMCLEPNSKNEMVNELIIMLKEHNIHFGSIITQICGQRNTVKEVSPTDLGHFFRFMKLRQPSLIPELAKFLIKRELIVETPF